MANKKFSQFDLKTNSADVQFVVGYNGTDNVRIAPSNLGGGGASDLNGLSDCLDDTDSLYVAEVPSGLSGNPQGNTVMGIDAGNALTSGNQNTLIGNDAGLNLATGQRNVSIGYQAGRAQTDSQAVNIGATAGYASSTLYQAISIGFESNFTGLNERSIAIGYQTGFNGWSRDSVLIGERAGRGGGGLNSVHIGGQAGYNYVYGANGGISIGYQAAYSNTSGTKNLNIGYKAGYNITTATDNTNIGYETG